MTSNHCEKKKLDNAERGKERRRKKNPKSPHWRTRTTFNTVIFYLLFLHSSIDFSTYASCPRLPRVAGNTANFLCTPVPRSRRNEHTSRGKRAIRQPPDPSTDEQTSSVPARGGGAAGRSEKMTSDILNLGFLSCFFVYGDGMRWTFCFSIQHCPLVVPCAPCRASQLPAGVHGNTVSANHYGIWIDLWAFVSSWAFLSEAFISLASPFQENRAC